MEFAERLRALIAERGVSQNALARQAYCSQPLISLLASGRRQPSPATARRLDQVLRAGGELAAHAPGGFDFAEPMRALMAERGISDAALARKIMCDVSYIRGLRNRRGHPSPRITQRLDEILGAGGELEASAAAEHMPRPSAVAVLAEAREVLACAREIMTWAQAALAQAQAALARLDRYAPGGAPPPVPLVNGTECAPRASNGDAPPGPEG